MREITTARLTLTRLRPEHLAAFAAYRALPEVARYQSWEPGYGLEAAQGLLEAQRDVDLGTPGAWLQIAVVDRADAQMHGDVAVRFDEDQPASAQIGVTMRPSSWGRGYATEALRALLEAIFGELTAHRVYARSDERNAAVHALLTRLGFREEARLVESDWCKGEWTTVNIHALLSGEWYRERLAAISVGDPEPLGVRVTLSEPDPGWAPAYRAHAVRIGASLGAAVRRIEHVGSTSVPGLAAKPIIDIVLEVGDSADEAAYAPALQQAGYRLQVREPEWFEHRLWRDGEGTVHLHVFSAGCPETDRMVAFRDWLIAHAEDRERYAAAKRRLAARDWTYMQQYADAKTAVIAAIMARATS